jgi:hypothetical protein
MKPVLFAAVSVFLACTAAAAQDQAWLSGLTDEELTAVDGSTLTLSQQEGRLELSIRMRSGSETNSSFNFINENLGTVTDEGDKGQVSALFRRTDIGLEILYGDGRSASLVANTQDGLTLTRRTPTGESGCMSWYPAGHAFSPDERRAAVEAYAASLGIQPASPTPAAPGKKHGKKPAPVAAHPASLQSPCAPALHAPKSPLNVRSASVHTIDNDAAPPPPPTASAAKPVATAAAQPVPATSPPPAAQPSSYRSIKLAFTTAQTGLAGPDAARLSIFVGEFLTSGTSALSIIPPNGTGADVASFFRDRLVTLGVPSDHIVTGTRTPGDGEQRVELGYVGSASQANAGASSCLGVETNGADLGFRNRCAYGVQFAYCVIKSADPALACESGSKAGLVGAGGFTPVLPGNDTKVAAEHDIRWVACDTDTGKVVAHIDRADPPSGRCERVN